MKSFCIFILLNSVLLLFSGCYLIKRAVYDTPGIEVVSPPPAPLSEIIVSYSGGFVKGWLNKTAPSTDSTPVILYLHGNNENLQTMLRTKIFGEFAKLKVNLFAIDYPGYGNSSGCPTEKNLIESTDSVFAYLKREFPTNSKFIAGLTMGAALAVKLGIKYQSDLKGIALICPWVSIDSMVALHYPRWMVTMFLKEKYSVLPIVEDLEVPVLVVHGEMDRTVPFMQGKKVADALPQLKKWQILKGTDQNNLFLNQKLWESLTEFINYPDIDWSQRE